MTLLPQGWSVNNQTSLFRGLLAFGTVFLLFIGCKLFKCTVSEREVVDLGLSVLWATRHVGASSCEQMGDKFAWGETETKRSFTRDNCIYYEKVTWTYTDIGKDISGTEFDVAHVKWGGKWRMPTLDEINELKKNCTWEWSRVNEVNGYKVIGKNGNSIFIPIIDGDTSSNLTVGLHVFLMTRKVHTAMLVVSVLLVTCALTRL